MQKFFTWKSYDRSFKRHLIRKTPPEILLDVQGVGYELLLPMTSFYDYLKSGKKLLYLPTCCA